MGNVLKMNHTMQIRATKQNAHFMGIAMAASVRQEGGVLVILRHDLHMTVPLGHWVTLQGGEATVTECEPVAI